VKSWPKEKAVFAVVAEGGGDAALMTVTVEKMSCSDEKNDPTEVVGD
jgi:hypothetical protein